MKTPASAFRSAASVAAVCALALAAAPALAGIKYWDNGDYDADSYVSDGLVLNYDGIRNVGLGQPHSTTTARWENLAPSAYDMYMDWVSYTGASDSASLTRSRGNTTQGNWNDSNGFVFNGRVCWMKWNNQNGADAVVVPAQYTMQFAMTANTADQAGGDYQTGYLFMPHSNFNWTKGAVALRSTANGEVTTANAVYAVDEERLGSSGIRPYFVISSPKYATVLSDAASLRIFAGTTPPGEGDPGHAAITGTAPSRANNWIAIGGNGSRAPASSKSDFQGFNGTLHSYRLYSRALAEDDLAWNRVVDEKRFFGTQLPIPATNAVIRSNLRLVSGAEPVGSYAVDASGYTFTAPAATTVSGHVYALVSATKETWDAAAGAWGTAETVAVDAESGASVAVASTDLVRISWKWRETSGVYTAADYTIDDIVTDGLEMHYDGILNDGAGKAHADNPMVWQNLADGYEDWPLVRVDYKDDDGDGKYQAIRSFYYSTHAGAWSANGFVFDGNECMMKWNDSGDHKFVLNPEYTFQFTMTATSADQAENTDGLSYLFFPHSEDARNPPNGTWKEGSISLRATSHSASGNPAGSVVMTDETRYGTTDIRPGFQNANPRFANIVADSTAARVFDGVEWPVSGQSYKAGTVSSSRTSNWIVIGGQYNPQTGDGSIKTFQGFHGTLHSIRYYDRALEEWELKRNRNVDSARFFGELGVTNLVVEVEDGSGIVATPAAGAYSVEGQYTFTAAGSAVHGRVWDLDEATGAWVNPQEIPGGSYTYDEAAATATTQKLRWSRIKAFVILVR